MTESNVAQLLHTTATVTKTSTNVEETANNKLLELVGNSKNHLIQASTDGGGVPTAKVAPLVGHSHHRSQGHATRQELTTVSTKRDNKESFLSESTPCFTSPRRVSLMRDGITVGKEDKLRSLMALLDDRSQIIEKQKQTISKLQKECQEKEAQLRTLIPLETSDTNDSAISSSVRIDILSRKLDEAYYELDTAKSNQELTQHKLSDKLDIICKLEKQLEELRKDKHTLEEKIVKLEGYIGNVPTMEEHYSLKDERTELHSQCISLKGKLKEIEEKLMEQNLKLREKEEKLNEQNLQLNENKQEIADLKLKCKGGDKRIVELHSDNSQLKVEIQKLKQIVCDLELQNKQDLRDMRERHKQRFVEATAKLKEQYRAVAKRNRQLEIQLVKSSDVMTALNNELQISQGTVVDLKSSITDLITQNQALMEKNVGLPEIPQEGLKGSAVCTPVSDISDDTVLMQLNQEMSSCVEEVESLVTLASSIFEGKDPNVSVLLGVTDSTKGYANSLANEGDVVEGESSSRYISQLQQIQRNRKEIERLRELMADRFASHVANECHMQ